LPILTLPLLLAHLSYIYKLVERRELSKWQNAQKIATISGSGKGCQYDKEQDICSFEPFK
jgi:hypothetical protein